MKQKFASILIMTALTLLPSCGYKMSGQSAGLPEEIKTIAITVFENNSLEPNIEATITKAIAEKFTSDGRLKVVPEGRADAILSGIINSYSINPTAYGENFDVTSYQSSISITFQLKDRLGLSVDLSSTVSAQSSYSVSSSMASTESSRLTAIETIGQTAGQNIVGALLESF